ncbi:MAG: MliC family protein [Paracoccaceae bacterium]
MSLVAQPSNSGTKYKTVSPDAAYEFWINADSAQFTLPDGSNLTCYLEVLG